MTEQHYVVPIDLYVKTPDGNYEAWVPTEIQRQILVQSGWKDWSKPEPSVPEGIKDLLDNPMQYDEKPFTSGRVSLRKEIVEKIAIEAYQRGQKAGLK